jgi:hypothetical protein
VDGWIGFMGLLVRRCHRAYSSSIRSALLPYADPGATLDASRVIVRLANVRLGC